jgi:hypothetical protein
VLKSHLGSAGHTVSAVHSLQSVPEIVDEIEAQWTEARARTVSIWAARATTMERP